MESVLMKLDGAKALSSSPPPCEVRILCLCPHFVDEETGVVVD